MNYQVTGTDEYGRLYNEKGLLQQYKQSHELLLKGFASLEEAEEYCDSIVRLYPQIQFHINSGSESIKTIQDDEYWAWKEKNTEEWVKINDKGRRLQSSIVSLLLLVVGMLLAILSHYANNVSLLAKLIVFPVTAIGIWHAVQFWFARKC